MTPDERRRAADAVLSIPFFSQLWSEMEEAAVNACINAPNTDHEARQAHAAEVRAIRKVRSRLESISKEGQSTGNRSAPA